MTRLSKPIKRTVAGLLSKELIVSLYPGGLLGFREFRSKREYTLPIMSAYNLAILAERTKRKTKR